MTRFQFKESRLLKLRQQQVGVAEFQHAAAANEVAEARSLVAANLHQLESLAECYMTDANALTLMSQTSLGMRVRLEEARGLLQQKLQVQAEARLRLLAAKRRADSLSAMRDRKLVQFKRDRRRRAGKDLDSLSIRSWIRSRHVDD